MSLVDISPRQRQETLYRVQGRTLHRVGVRFSDIRQVNDYLARLVDSEWFGDLWPDFFHVIAERRRANARYSCAIHEDSAILLADLGQSTVLHELAHLLAGEDHGHDYLYTEILLTLVRHEMGFNAWADFYNALKATPEYSPIRKGI